jgi:hypothetical protein
MSSPHDGYRLQVLRWVATVPLFTQPRLRERSYPRLDRPEALRDSNAAVRYRAPTVVGHLWSVACQLFLATMFMSPAPVPRR